MELTSRVATNLSARNGQCRKSEARSRIRWQDNCHPSRASHQHWALGLFLLIVIVRYGAGQFVFGVVAGLSRRCLAGAGGRGAVAERGLRGPAANRYILSQQRGTDPLTTRRV